MPSWQNIQFRRIQFIADLENKKSQREIEKLSVIKEGVFRSNYLDSEEKSKDEVYYSVILEEWAVTKREYFGNLFEENLKQSQI